MPRGRSGRSDRARATFLGVLEKTCNVSAAAREAGISRRAAYDWRDADQEFAADWKDAEEAAADRLEQVAFERAEAGQSDRMLEILLKAHRPKYRENKRMELTGADGGPMRFDLSGLSDEELEQLEAIRSRLAIAGGDQGGEGQASNGG